MILFKGSRGDETKINGKLSTGAAAARTARFALLFILLFSLNVSGIHIAGAAHVEGTQVGGVVMAAPTAVDDSYSIDEDAVLSIAAPGVLQNDSDPESDPLIAVLVDDVGNGTLAFNADGSFTYTGTDQTGSPMSLTTEQRTPTQQQLLLR